MSVIDYPFFNIDGKPKPALPVQLINPANGFEFSTWALIDTGADATVIPAYIANQLYHDITHKDVITDRFWGMGGTSMVYYHTFRLNIFKSNSDGIVSNEKAIKARKRLYAVEKTLRTMVLGESDFLNRYIITIDYPKKILSLRKPHKK